MSSNYLNKLSVISFIFAAFFKVNAYAADLVPQIEEIVQTEKNFNQAMKAIKQHYVDFIANDRKDQNVRNIGIRLNSSLAPIIKLSDEVLKEMEKDKTATGMGKLFKKYAEFYKMYGLYAADLGDFVALSNTNTYKQNAGVIAATKRINKLSGEPMDYLIRPVQRIGLLVSLLKDVAKAKPDNNEVKEAYSEMDRIGKYVNAYKRSEIK